MSSKVITYSTGLPVIITINEDGIAEVGVDLSEVYQSVFDSPSLHLGDDEVEEYDDEDLERIRVALDGAPAFALVNLESKVGEPVIELV